MLSTPNGVAVRVPRPEALEIIKKGADRRVHVADEEVAAAIRAYHEDTHNMAEGAAGAALAALIQERDRMKGKRIAVILSGANISRSLLVRVLSS